MDVAWSDWTDEILDQMLCTEVHRLIHTSGAQARKQQKLQDLSHEITKTLLTLAENQYY